MNDYWIIQVIKNQINWNIIKIWWVIFVWLQHKLALKIYMNYIGLIIELNKILDVSKEFLE